MRLARFGSFGSLLFAAMLAGLAGCGSSSGLKPTPKCLYQSDCAGALACVEGYCVAKCMSSKDCNPAGRCIMTAEGTTCEAPEAATCHYNSQCTQPLVCAGDFQCRSQCRTMADCPTGQFCTTTSKLCADPALDPSYDPATNEFRGADASFGAGIDKLPVGLVGTAGGSGSGAGASGSSGLDGAAGAAGADGGVKDAPVEQPGVVITSACPGTPQTLFSKLAVGDTNAGYTSGVGARLPTQMVIFNGFTGYDDVPDGGAGGGDAGATAPLVNRIDYQLFDLTGVSKGPAKRLAVVEGHPEPTPRILVLGATAAPTGEVALVYAAGDAAGAGIYLKLLAADTLAVTQTVQLQSVGGTRYGHQAHVEWEDGQFLASWVSYMGGSDTSFLNVATFLKDGTPTGSVSAVPTNAIDSRTRNVDYEQASVAFSNGVFAIAYETVDADNPALTFFGTDGNQVGSTLLLPYKTTIPNFTVVGATTKGFIAVYDGQISASDDAGAPTAFATQAVFVPLPSAADGGAPTPGGVVTLSGLATFNQQNAARASSDALGAGFALLTNDGKATFVYFEGDGSKHLGPAQVIQQVPTAGALDEVGLMNLSGSYGLSPFAGGEHLTRMAVSGCPASATNWKSELRVALPREARGTGEAG